MEIWTSREKLTEATGMFCELCHEILSKLSFCLQLTEYYFTRLNENYYVVIVPESFSSWYFNI